MDTSRESLADGYESLYREFDSPLMRQLRREAYGEDIGQHSWVGAEELRGDIHRLKLAPSSRVLDLGCRPCGPLTFILAAVGCSGTGVELSPSALQVGARRNAPWHRCLALRSEADLNESLPFEPRSFDAAMSLDVVLQLRDRSKLSMKLRRCYGPAEDSC
jgi:SAM-dependent methyltransferase